MKEPRLVIIGGGIAAVSCVEAIYACNRSSDVSPAITVICASELVKAATNVELVSRYAEQFDVEQRPLTWLASAYPNVKVMHAVARLINGTEKSVDYQLLRNDRDQSVTTLTYDRLCICTGGKPRRLDRHSNFSSLYNDFIITIRDTDSVRSFQHRLQSGVRRVMIVGNGGIATELAYELAVNSYQNSLEVIWAVRHKSIAATFIDAGAAEFLLQTARKKPAVEKAERSDANFTITKRRKYTVEEQIEENVGNSAPDKPVQGSALGPDWLQQYQLITGDKTNDARTESRLHIAYECEVNRFYLPAELPEAGLHATCPSFGLSKPSVDENSHIDVDTNDWPLYVQLTNGRIFGCDFVINATGVDPYFPPVVCATPRLEKYDGIKRGLITDERDHGIVVDQHMQSSIPDLYAAGDCCTAGWQRSAHWMQMRLWTQARQMGHYAGKCMLASCTPDYDAQTQENVMDFCFEIFTHVTSFFNFKVVLLGLFNLEQQQQQRSSSQQTSTTDDDKIKVIARIEPGEQYIKVVLQKSDEESEGKVTVAGAVLVGETDMEETLENLILNQTDVSQHGEHLLDPNMDVEDYFD